MSARSFRSTPFDLVVFGGTGDLARRKLMPALYLPRPRRPAAAREPDHRPLARRCSSREAYAAQVEAALREHVPRRATSTPAARALPRPAPPRHARRHRRGAAGTSSRPAARRRRRPRPGLLPGHRARPVRPDLPHSSAQAGLVTPQARVVLEKPIGHDLASARGDQRRGRRGLRRGRRSSASTTTSARRRCRT